MTLPSFDPDAIARAGVDVIAGESLAATRTGDFRHDPSIDHGRVVQKSPAVVLRPRDRDALVACVQHLFATRTRYVLRGAAHSAGGQVLTDGVVLDLRHLDRIVDDDPVQETITVEGGTWWLAVVEHLRAQGRRPMSVTANLRSSVAGTLAVGGFGDSAHLWGLQIDHVERMTLCTPDGTVHHVGRDDELFCWTLAGRGQLAVILDVTLRTQRRPWQMAGCVMAWNTLAEFARDAELMAARELFDFVRARVQLRPDGRSVVYAHVGRTAATLAELTLGETRPVFVSAPELVDVHALLTAEKATHRHLACPALELVFPMPGAIDTWNELAPQIASARIPELQPAGHSVMLVSRNPRLPLAPLPSATSMMIALRPQLPIATVDSILPALRAIGRHAMELGAKLYLMSIDLEDPQFAERQFGERLARLRDLKTRHDPYGLLNGGFLW